MESFIKLYFGNALGRSRVIMTIIYFIGIIFVVSGVLEWFGICYSFPKEITVAVAFNFVLSGQILYPVAGVILYYSVSELFASLVANKLYNKYKFYIFRQMSDDGMISTIESELLLKKIISWTFLPGPKPGTIKKGPIEKGVSFHDFEPTLKAMFWEDFNVVSSWKLSAHAMFAIMLALGFYLNTNPLVIVAFILVLLGWIVYLLGYWHFSRQNEYRQLYEQMYFNLINPSQAKEIQMVSTWNRYSKGFQNWEKKRQLQKRLKRWNNIIKIRKLSNH